MALTLRNIKGTVKISGAHAVDGQNLTSNDLVETDADGSCTIFSDGAPAVDVHGKGPTHLSTYTPPSNDLLRYWYNTSYRFNLNAPGGNVGIRG